MVQQIRTDKAIPEDQRTAQLGGIRAETERSLVEAFGQKAFELYQARSGQWLAQLGGEKP